MLLRFQELKQESWVVSLLRFSNLSEGQLRHRTLWKPLDRVSGREDHLMIFLDYKLGVSGYTRY